MLIEEVEEEEQRTKMDATRTVLDSHDLLREVVKQRAYLSTSVC